MCHHHDEAMTWEEIQARHRADETEERADEIPDADVVDEPAGDAEETEPPAEPRAPADD